MGVKLIRGHHQGDQDVLKVARGLGNQILDQIALGEHVSKRLANELPLLVGPRPKDVNNLPLIGA